MKKKLPKDCLPACVSCIYFNIEPKDDLGFCRRFPPTILAMEGGDFDCVFAIVSKDDWCGEFIRKVN
jgi:hypothetical protein